MRRDIRCAIGSVHWLTGEAMLALAIMVTAVAAAGAAEAVCRDPMKPMQQVELMFGRNIGDGLGVDEAQWSRFLSAEVTPRFPDGLSVIDAAGQWRENGRLVREPSKLVIIVMPDSVEAHDRITAIVSAYKELFHQQSVRIIMRAVCAAP
jgi:hypothetical protein